MIPRYGISIGIAAAVTFALLFVMQLLIATGRGALIDERIPRVLDLVRIERTEVVERKREKPDKPPEPQPHPELPKTSSFDDLDARLAVSMVTPDIDAAAGAGALGFGISDGEYTPLFMVAPVYPPQALVRGIEGYVLLEFTVTRLGTTKDIRVVDSTSSLLNRAAIDAASRFKYKPRVVAGQAVDVEGVTSRISFVIDR
jgi:periplasmic protein TonB